jgi:gliding motility-associated-like protein
MKSIFALLAFALISIQGFGQVYEMDLVNGQTINTCNGTFFDSQALDLVPGSGDLYYDNGENFQVTFCAPNAGDEIRFDFEFLQIAAGEDTLWVYDGANTASAPVAIFSGGYATQSIVGFSGCLTFVFVSTGLSVSTGWEADISCFNVPLVPIQPGCTNVGFESGNFNGWYGTYGIPTLVIPATGPTAMSNGIPGSATPNYFPDVYGAVLAPYHTVTTGAALDPYGNFPIVSPTGGNNSIRLGDLDNPFYGGSSLEQKFNVTAANATMIYSYAVVIQNALDATGVPHISEEQPYFQIEAFDCAGNSIPCGDFLVVGGPNIPGFSLSALGVDVYYKPWTDVFLDLSAYIGSCVTVKFTQGDCTLGAHFSYVYLDASCAPLEITGPQYICPGEFVTLTAPSGAAQYNWLPGGQTTQSITVSPAVYTDYSCELTSVVGPACTATADYWVDLYPSASVSASDESTCAGIDVTLNAVPGTPGGTYVWTPGGAITASVDVSPLVTTDYIVDYTNANNCVGSDTITVTVIPSPIIDPIADIDICPNEPINAIVFTASLPGTSFTWTNTNPAIGLAAAGVGDIPAFIGLNGGAATVSSTITVTPYDGVCFGPEEIFTITVNPTPVVFAGNPIVVCDGEQITLTGTGALNYVWDNGVVDGVAFSATTGWYTVIGTDQFGCVNIDSVMVTTEPAPAPDFDVVVAPCEPWDATLTVVGAGSYSNCVWNISNGAVLNGCGPINYTFPNPGTFDITLTTTTPLGCDASITYTDIVFIEPSPIASFNPGFTTLTSLNTDIQFDNTSSNATSYEWIFGDGSPISSEENPFHTFPNEESQSSEDESSSYIVTLIATNASGCTDTAYSTIIVDEELIFYVPNTFTPDGDDYNEYFKAIFTSGYDPYDFHLLIFNRWGEIIWESYDDSVGWDATYGGRKVQDGTYTWKIEFKRSLNDERIVVLGHVNVIR